MSTLEKDLFGDRKIRIKRMSEISDKYDAFILDQYGVMHNGAIPLPGALECFESLKKAGKRIAILSNTSRRSKDALKKLRALGFQLDSEESVITSGEECWKHMNERMNGKSCVYLTWKREVEDDDKFLDGLNISTSDVSTADFILCHGSEIIVENSSSSPVETGFIEHGNVLLAYQKVLAVALNRGLEMLVANADYRHANNSSNQTSLIGQQYQLMGGKVKWFGKPHSEHFQACLKTFGEDIKYTRVVHVGDSLDHDIQGAADANLDSVFILGGVHAQEVGLTTGKDGLTTGEQDEEKINKLLADEGCHPKWILEKFVCTGPASDSPGLGSPESEAGRSGGGHPIGSESEYPIGMRLHDAGVVSYNIDNFRWVAWPTRDLNGKFNSRQAGIGVILGLNANNSLFIHTVCPKGSSDGYLRKGDILIAIGCDVPAKRICVKDAAENEDVSSKSASSVANLLLGPEGSQIDITVMRGSDGSVHDQEFLSFCLTRKKTDAATARHAIRKAVNERNLAYKS
ncbi:hypothetical protein GUITHDRAFT_161791 [Guillardia theta CCMP2712]|uniref:PDZ domain-containing protein n=1 Tax=Guillardia theta (strain CCMP2712) TaxID=905079 RepID=L1JPQ0_GUITC|nr:hypothetical protein GUITHDRAFT_161791 [Guillardia theta CCMP2712]EKX50422.1 hypothetical protein GUITHDRAFT_161791 [Guillardia theta CCMP2712]|eukprot:XP_005837402.1 hypothetical protein GUITHDRAFT_161791 [Guillardia theta CCMP2712]